MRSTLSSNNCPPAWGWLVVFMDVDIIGDYVASHTVGIGETCVTTKDFFSCFCKSPGRGNIAAQMWRGEAAGVLIVMP